MNLVASLDLARSTHQSVLTTIQPDGRPHITSVLHHAGEDGLIRISITATRVKYRNLAANAWAAVHVTGADFWTYAVLEGEASLSAVAAEPGDATVDELVRLYRDLSGEHPDWEDYRAAMVRDQRVVARLRPTRAYGQIR